MAGKTDSAAIVPSIAANFQAAPSARYGSGPVTRAIPAPWVTPATGAHHHGYACGEVLAASRARLAA
ncbi:hypothetical protein GCM10010448_49290 [Streptomyces glomeratus]|uniref:Uncharacterized protein n=1 Tax=Streptomyces glomeratus TaxID=284452 RepID=A0ABP6LXX5_9ACTN